MVYPLSLAAALLLAFGWVLQQREAARQDSPPLSWRLITTLVRRRRWWRGVLAMIGAQVFGAWAFQVASVSLVDCITSTYLVFAFVIASLLGRHRPRWQEVLGATLVTAALAVFIAAGRPQAHTRPSSTLGVAVATASVLAVVAVLVAVGRRGATRGAVVIATAAGCLYGLQDAASRGALERVTESGWRVLLTGTPWAYVLVAAGAAGVLLSQSAFRAARLDYSLPPVAVAEPLTGVALGIGVLGDQLSFSIPALALESASAVAMICGAVLIGRSPAFAPSAPVEPLVPAGHRQADQ